MFIQSDIKQLKEQRKQFEKISQDLDTAFNKNAEAIKNKPQICDEMEKNLASVKKTYGQNGLEYICQINRFYLVKSHSILNIVIKFQNYFKKYLNMF